MAGAIVFGHREDILQWYMHGKGCRVHYLRRKASHITRSNQNRNGGAKVESIQGVSLMEGFEPVGGVET